MKRLFTTTARRWTLLILSLCILYVVTPLVHAENLVWNQTYITRVCGPAGRADSPAVGGHPGGRSNMKFCKWIKADNPNVSVHYRVAVTNLDTGAIVPSGSAVPQGTRLQYAFMPHESTDITWFLTGYASDSPYGEWNAGAPILDCVEKDLIYGTHRREYASYAPFAVTPPTKHISGLDSISCETSAANKSCTMSAPGAYTATFVFDPTDGRFYGRAMSGKGCFGMNIPLQTQSSGGDRAGGEQSSFIVQVPQQTFSHTVIVSDEPVDPAHIPSVPALSSQGACVIGEPHAISFVSSDPDGDNLRYGIDWDNDGGVDQWMPPSGYVASGVSQSATRTYSTAGTKRVAVLAQDEGGLTSSWASTSFSCAPDSATAGLNDGDNGAGDGSGDGSSFLPAGPDLDLRALPSLVRQGRTTQVNWSATNVESCTVQGSNGDAWSGVESPIGGRTSSPIESETTYTLTCTTEARTILTERVIVNVIPGFQEL